MPTDYTAARNAISSNPEYNDQTKGYLLSEIDKREQIDTQNANVPASIRAETPGLNTQLETPPYNVTANPSDIQIKPVDTGAGGATQTNNTPDPGLLSSSNNGNSTSVNNTSVVNPNEPISAPPVPIQTTNINPVQVPLAVPPKPAQTGSGGAATGYSPLQKTLLDINAGQRTQLFGQPGNSSNLTPEEQQRLDDIDKWQASGGDPQKADLYRNAVKQGAIARTKVTGTLEQEGNLIKQGAETETNFQNKYGQLTKDYSDKAATQDAKINAITQQNIQDAEKKDKDINDFVKTAPIYKEDANRYFKNMGAGRQVAFGLGAILEAAGNGWNGRKGSQAFDQLNTQIDRDIAAQRKTYEAASDNFKTKLQAMNTGFGRALQIGGNKENAEKLISLQLLNNYNNQLETLKQTTGSERIKNSADAAQLKLKEQMDTIDNSLKKERAAYMYPQKAGSGKPSEAQSKILGQFNQITDVISGLDSRSNEEGNPYDIKNKDVVTRGLAGIKDWALGEGSAFQALSPQDQKRSLEFANAQSNGAALTSTALGMGVLNANDPILVAIKQAKNEKELAIPLRQLQSIITANGMGVGGKALPPKAPPPNLNK